MGLRMFVTMARVRVPSWRGRLAKLAAMADYGLFDTKLLVILVIRGNGEFERFD